MGRNTAQPAKCNEQEDMIMSDFPSKEKALGMYKKMYEIRKYEESIYLSLIHI